MKKFKHLFAMFFALGFGFLVLVVLDEAKTRVETEKQAAQKLVAKTLKPVSVIEVSHTSADALIQSFGEVKPRWKTAIKAKRRGEVLTFSNALEAGSQIKKGEVLFTFDNAHYETQLADAKNQIAQAELLIQSEKEQARLVRQDWKILGKKGNPTAFMLRIPQIKAAQAQLKLAKANLNEITREGAYSRLIAPYDGIVISRSANVGDVVEAGQILTEIFSANSLEVAVKLNERQWGLLSKKWRGQGVDVFATGIPNSSTQNKKWRAIIDRGGDSINPETRQRTLYLKFNASSKPTVGRFVRVAIRGKKLTNLLKVPSSALTPQGLLWLVDDDNKLQSVKASALFSKDNSVFVKASIKALVKSSSPATKTYDKNYSIVVSPLSSFLTGMEVQPKRQ